jgi:hypothetical protein
LPALKKKKEKKMEFSVAEWTKEYKLSDDTIVSLDKKTSIIKLTKDIIKMEFKGLQIAQMLLLEDAVLGSKEPSHTRGTAYPEPPVAGNHPNGTEQKKLDAGKSLDVNDILTIIGKSSPTGLNTETAGKPALFDPVSFHIDNEGALSIE